jgi:hypothetical protein
MLGTTNRFISLACLAILAMASSVAMAGVLDDNPAAYNDGLGPGTGGRWAGSVPYNDGADLTGYIDFAVFSAANFNSNFGGLGYAPADSLVYTYQMFNTGSDFASAQIVGVTNPASAIGQFNIGDVTASGMSLSSGTAEWDFPGILTGQSSYGLACSSPNAPEMGAGLTFDGGSGVLTLLPTPSASAIPEPASFLLLACGSLMLFVVRKRR